MLKLSQKELAGYIDHTLLNANATQGQIKKLCDEAKEFGFKCVCVNPRWARFIVEELKNYGTSAGSVVSLPLGADTTKIKAAQAREIIEAGVDEVDFVADLASIVDRDEKYLTNEFEAIADVCRSVKRKIILKVIIESAALNEEQIKFVCQIASRCGVDFVKTSTGMNPAGGAKIEHIKLMKKYAGDCKVKAAGGIKTAQQAIEMIGAGAERIGTSAAVAIMKECKSGTKK